MPDSVSQGAALKSIHLGVPLRHPCGGQGSFHSTLGGHCDRACPHAGPAGGMLHQDQDSFSSLHHALEWELVHARFMPLLQVLPTRPAAPPCTQSAPSAASTWWASAPSRTACTSAPTLSPVRTSGTRQWLSLAAALTPVSSTSDPVPLGCSTWGQ